MMPRCAARAPAACWQHRRRSSARRRAACCRRGSSRRRFEMSILACDEDVGRAIVRARRRQHLEVARHASDQVAQARLEGVAQEAASLRPPSIVDGRPADRGRACRGCGSRSLRPGRWRTAGCWDRRTPASSRHRPHGRRAAPAARQCGKQGDRRAHSFHPCTPRRRSDRGRSARPPHQEDQAAEAGDGGERLSSCP